MSNPQSAPVNSKERTPPPRLCCLAMVSQWVPWACPSTPVAVCTMHAGAGIRTMSPRHEISSWQCPQHSAALGGVHGCCGGQGAGRCARLLWRSGRLEVCTAVVAVRALLLTPSPCGPRRLSGFCVRLSEANQHCRVLQAWTTMPACPQSCLPLWLWHPTTGRWASGRPSATRGMRLAMPIGCKKCLVRPRPPTSHSWHHLVASTPQQHSFLRGPHLRQSKGTSP